MKNLLLGLSLFTSFNAFAGNSPPACLNLAKEKAQEIFINRELESFSCKKMKTKLKKIYHRCEISGSNGDGAGDFEVLILINADCSKVTFSMVTGEE